MKKLIALLFALAWSPAHAAVPCALPFTLTNNTIADANQVMANYNAIITCLGNAAISGINPDITQLTGLVTPLTPAQGGTSIFIGPPAGSTGSANAQVVATTTPGGFTVTFGNRVLFLSGFTNTAAMTLQVGSTTARPVCKRSPFAALTVQPLQGGEIIATQLVDAMWDGTCYEITPASPLPAGTVLDFAGTNIPAGFFLADGSCVSSTTFNNLYTIMGDTFTVADGCAAGNFGLPDLRGRVVAGLDTVPAFGGGPLANRITVAGGNFDSGTFSNAGGVQNHVLTVGSIPTLNVTAGTLSGASISCTGCVTGGTVTVSPQTIATGHDPAVSGAGVSAAAVTPATVSSSNANQFITTTINYTLGNNFATTGAGVAVTGFNPASSTNSQNTANAGVPPGASVNNITVSGTTAAGQTATCSACVNGGSVVVGGIPVTGGTGSVASGNISGGTVTGGLVGSQTTSGSTGAAVPGVQPTMILYKIIKY